VPNDHVDPFKHVSPDAIVIDTKNQEIVKDWLDQKVKNYDSSLSELRLLMAGPYDIQNLKPYQTDRMAFPLAPLHSPTEHHKLRQEFTNYGQYDDWTRGEAELLPRDVVPTINFFGEDALNQELATVAKSVLATAVHHNPQRVSKLLSATGDQTNLATGEVMWDISEAYYGLPASPGPIRSLVHEITHAASPSGPRPEFIRILKDENATKRHLGVESGNLPTIFAFNTMWMDVARANLEFFEKRFFSVDGDGTLGMITNDENTTQHGIDECIAMLAADFAYPDGIEVPLNEWPNDIIMATEITWNFIRNGNSSQLLPINAEEIDQVRTELKEAYSAYCTSRKTREATDHLTPQP